MDTGFFVSCAEAETTTLAVLIERYRNEVTPYKKGASSEYYRLNALNRCGLGRRFVAGIRGNDIAQYRDERLKKVSSATVKRDLVLLGHIFEIARKEWGINVGNPVRDIRHPRDSRPRNRRLETGEELRLFEACKAARNSSLFPIVQLALETAMRQSEIVSLKWENVRLDNRTAYLPETKNGEPRTVPLSSTSHEILSTLDVDITTRVFAGVTSEAVKLWVPNIQAALGR